MRRVLLLQLFGLAITVVIAKDWVENYSRNGDGINDDDGNQVNEENYKTYILSNWLVIVYYADGAFA